MAINGIRPSGGPSSLSRYEIIQPFWIQACNSCSYSPWSRLGVGYSESLFFRDTGSWSQDHFQDAVHTRLASSDSAWKSCSSRVMAEHISFSRWGNLTLPVKDIAILPSCLIAFSPSSRSYPSRSPSTTRACTATEGPLLIPIWTTLSTQHIDELPPTTSKGTFFFSHVWQHCLHTRVCVQPVSTRAVRLTPSICTVTTVTVVCTDNKWEIFWAWDFRTT